MKLDFQSWPNGLEQERRNSSALALAIELRLSCINPSMCDYSDELLTHCGLGDFNEILDEYFSSQLQWLMAEIPAVKLPSEECH